MAILSQIKTGGWHGGWRVLLLAWLTGLALNSLPAQTVSREYQLKAVFLYNFAQFTDWPTTAFPKTNSPVVIGIFGKDPFGNVLDDTVKGESINGRSLVVRRFARLEDINECQLLFISASETNRLPQILSAVKGRSTLTVGETDNFVLSGGIILFATSNNKIRLRINLDAARQANLTISSKLLRLADIVTAEKD